MQPSPLAPPGNAAAAAPAARSDLNGPLLAVLCLLVGIFGGHRFYAGRTGTAVLQLLTFGGLGVWTFIDLLFVLFGEFRDVHGRKVDVWGDFWKDF